MMSLVAELQEAWAQVDSAWHSCAPSSAGDDAAREAASQAQQQPLCKAALAASEEAGCSAAPLLALVERAPAALAGLSPDDFPRILAWADGLCGLTLLPLSLFEGVVPAASWLDGRPCLVPLANLWLHRVSPAPPQLD